MRILLLLPILLMACTTPKTPAQDVYLAESDYAVALRIELAYSNLPRCPAAKICSDVATIKKVQKYDNAAWAAIKEAQTAVRTKGFGDSKITTTVATATALTRAFVGVTDQLKVK